MQAEETTYCSRTTLTWSSTGKTSAANQLKSCGFVGISPTAGEGKAVSACAGTAANGAITYLFG